METESIRIPVKASYSIKGGEVVKIAAEYADVPVRIVAKILKEGMKK